MVIPLFAGRPKSLEAIEHASGSDNKIVVVAQADPNVEDPTPNQLYKVGVVAKILQVLRLQDSTVKVLVEGLERVKLSRFSQNDDYLRAHCKSYPDEDIDLPEDVEIVAMRRSIMSNFEEYSKFNSKIAPDVIANINGFESATEFAYGVASHVMMKTSLKQEILESPTIKDRMRKLLTHISSELELLKTESKIKNMVRSQVEKNQKDYYLNEQLKAIHKELGDEDLKEEIQEMKERAKKLKLSTEAAKKVNAELKKLQAMNPMSSEATVIRNYVDWVLSLPWKKYSTINRDLKNAQSVLDTDHYGLDKIKERIIEYLAVNLRVNNMKSPILCFVGPPGVGKTSLGQSIARAQGRKFVKIALGGVRDESEIRGHRRTYIGSLPGRIIQAMKKAEVSNPVILLDEIDKLCYDYRGDPAAALLEVLDPEQNDKFTDHYLEVDYDLSRVMFIATANSTDLPAPLLDRLEVLNIAGYTDEEKLNIAKRHLLPKQKEGHGLKEAEMSLTDDAILDIIHYYTRESGVRNLDRAIARLARKITKAIMIEGDKGRDVASNDLEGLLGIRKFSVSQIEETDLVGVTNGLAYTSVGGELLGIETVLMPGDGKVKLTGKLGDVMRESAEAALSYIRSRSHDFGIPAALFNKKDIHLHVPEGATPKDGPSAGITMCTSMVSLLTSIPVRKDVAMTGEITLRGRVLPIGGLKEKLLAALRGGIKKVLIPKENARELSEIPDNIKGKLEIELVDNVDAVLRMALAKPLTPLAKEEEDEVVKVTTEVITPTDHSINKVN
jgi:ATP-dependent Lon protease